MKTVVEQNREIQINSGFIRAKDFKAHYESGTAKQVLVRRDYLITYRGKGWKVYPITDKVTATRAVSTHDTLIQALRSIN